MRRLDFLKRLFVAPVVVPAAVKALEAPEEVRVPTASDHQEAYEELCEVPAYTQYSAYGTIEISPEVAEMMDRTPKESRNIFRECLRASMNKTRERFNIETHRIMRGE